MNICKQPLIDLLSDDPENWKKRLGIDSLLLEKILSGKGVIHIKTATRILEAVNTETNNTWGLEDLFDISLLRGVETERTNVIYEYGAKPLSEEEKAGVIRLLMEGTVHGYLVWEILIILIIISSIAGIFIYIYQ